MAAKLEIELSPADVSRILCALHQRYNRCMQLASSELELIDSGEPLELQDKRAKVSKAYRKEASDVAALRERVVRFVESGKQASFTYYDKGDDDET